VLGRWRDFERRPHVIGWTARTDRYGDTRLIGRPSEINLFALKRAVEDPAITADRVYDEFITRRYGAASLPYVRPAFQNAFDIVTSTLYTLGTNVANHSSLDFDPYSSSYARHVTGKWLEPPVARVGHGVNRELHYWRDVVDHIAPVWAKAERGAQWSEVPWVKENGWITPGEMMNEEYLRMILTEKAFGVEKARESLDWIERGRASLGDAELSQADYADLHHYFARTLLTARLYHATAKAYYGFRVWARGGEHRTPFVTSTVREGLAEMRAVAREIESYPVKPAVGQWNWVEDAEKAMEYHRWITTGWPMETSGTRNPYGGLAFPAD